MLVWVTTSSPRHFTQAGHNRVSWGAWIRGMVLVEKKKCFGLPQGGHGKEGQLELRGPEGGSLDRFLRGRSKAGTDG